MRVDGLLHDLDEEITLDKKYKHSIDVVVDRLVVRHAGDDGDAATGREPHGRLDRDGAAAVGGRRCW